MTPPIRLFVSSPSDVAAERQAVERVARRVEGLFDGVAIEVYRWEADSYYSAHTGFQEQIAEIGGFDLVVGVLWSRLGSPLPPGFAARMPPPRAGEPYPSGTAFELLEAIRLRRERDRAPPDILVYRKRALASFDVADNDAALARQTAEVQRVNQFMKDFFVNDEDGFKAAFKTFVTLDEFEAALEADLTAWLKANHRMGGQHPWPIAQRGAPFVGLNAFDLPHRAVFFGRRPEIERARERLEAGQGFLLIDGASGTGKSSLVRAGLLPRLTDLDPHLRVAIAVPETEAPLLALVQALFAPEALPDLAQGDYPTAHTLARHIAAGGDAAPILRALDRAADRLQAADRLEAPPRVALLLLVDQLEALFASRVPLAERAAYAGLLEQLVASGRVRVVATLRANAREEALALPSLGRLINASRGLALEPPTPAALGEIIRAPAAAAGIAYERDAEGAGLDEVLLAEVAQDPAALPLLQFALDRLYDSAATRVLAAGHRLGDVPPGEPVLTLTHADYRALGGLSGAIGQRAEAALEELPPAVVARLPALVRALTEAGGDTLVLGRAPLARAAPDPEARTLVDALVAARILVQGVTVEGAGPPVPGLRFSHERVLTAWPRARDAAQAAARYLRIRADLIRAEARWRAEGRAADLLIAPGLRLAEAETALRDYGDELDRLHPALRPYVESSTRRARLRQRLAYAAAGVFFVVALAAWWFAVDARQQSRLALQNQRSAIVALALSRAETRPHDAIALVLSMWPDRADGYSPSQSASYQALALAVAATRPHQMFTGHVGAVLSISVSPDGSRIASGGIDGVLRLWDVATGAMIAQPSLGQQSRIRELSFSPDGSRILIAGEDGMLLVRDAMSGEIVGEPLRGHRGEVWSATYSPDGLRIVSGGADGVLRLWDVTTGEIVGVPLSGHQGEVLAVAFSPDGRFIASGSTDGTLRIWSATDGTLLVSPLHGHRDWVSALAFSPDGSRIVSGGYDNSLRLWDASTGASLGAPFLGHQSVVLDVGFSFDGRLIVSGSRDGTLRIWNSLTGEIYGEPVRGHYGSVFDAEFSPDQLSVITSGSDGTVRIWQLGPGDPIGDPLRGHRGSVLSVAISPDGSRVVSGSRDRNLRLWDSETGEAQGVPLAGHIRGVSSVAFSPDGERIVSGSHDGYLRVWNNVVGSEPSGVLMRSTRPILSAAFSPDSRRIVSGGHDGSVVLWDAFSGLALWHTVENPQREVDSVAFSPSGERIVSGGRDGTVRFWNSQTGAPIGEPLNGHGGRVLSVRFSPDEIHVASGDLLGTVRLWRAADGVSIGGSMQAHQRPIYSVEFSPDGRRLLSGSHDGTLRFWDAATGVALGAPLRGHEGEVYSVAFFPDGNRVVSAGRDGTLRFWSNLPPGNILQVACRYLPHVNGRPTFPTETLAQELGLTNLTLPDNCDTYDPPIPPLRPAVTSD